MSSSDRAKANWANRSDQTLLDQERRIENLLAAISGVEKLRASVLRDRENALDLGPHTGRGRFLEVDRYERAAKLLDGFAMWTREVSDLRKALRELRLIRRSLERARRQVLKPNLQTEKP